MEKESTPSSDPNQNPELLTFLDALEKKGYFGNVSVGSPEYQVEVFRDCDV